MTAQEHATSALPRRRHARRGNDAACFSDGQLLSAVARGEESAFETVMERHQAQVWNYASLLTGSESDAHDLIAEARELCMVSVRDGNGPTMAFRPYFLTALHQLVLARRQGDSATFNPRTPGVPTLLGPPGTWQGLPLVQAFQLLPERMQLVLWHMVVEGFSADHLEVLMGSPASRLDVLSQEARGELIRLALAHRVVPQSEACRHSAPLLMKFLSDDVSAVEYRDVVTHIEFCDTCWSVVRALEGIDQGLRDHVAAWMLGEQSGNYLASLEAAKFFPREQRTADHDSDATVTPLLPAAPPEGLSVVGLPAPRESDMVDMIDVRDEVALDELAPPVAAPVEAPTPLPVEDIQPCPLFDAPTDEVDEPVSATPDEQDDVAAVQQVARPSAKRGRRSASVRRPAVTPFIADDASLVPSEPSLHWDGRELAPLADGEPGVSADSAVASAVSTPEVEATEVAAPQVVPVPVQEVEPVNVEAPAPAETSSQATVEPETGPLFAAHALNSAELPLVGPATESGRLPTLAEPLPQPSTPTDLPSGENKVVPVEAERFATGALPTIDAFDRAVEEPLAEVVGESAAETAPLTVATPQVAKQRSATVDTPSVVESPVKTSTEAKQVVTVQNWLTSSLPQIQPVSSLASLTVKKEPEEEAQPATRSVLGHVVQRSRRAAREAREANGPQPGETPEQLSRRAVAAQLREEEFQQAFSDDVLPAHSGIVADIHESDGRVPYAVFVFGMVLMFILGVCSLMVLQWMS